MSKKRNPSNPGPDRGRHAGPDDAPQQDPRRAPDDASRPDHGPRGEGRDAEQSAEVPRGEPAGPEPAEEPRPEDREELLGRLQRVSADYLNYQKRVQRDIAQAREFANEDLIKALLSVLDDMERALAAARANHDEDDPFLTGMQLVHDNALAVLGRFGVTQIDPAGELFDPQQHQAMMQQPSAEHPPQTVLQTLQKGYQLKGRTLRPAGVIVSTAAEDASGGTS
jgi:molecular chaperone GrpE